MLYGFWHLCEPQHGVYEGIGIGILNDMNLMSVMFLSLLSVVAIGCPYLRGSSRALCAYAQVP
jgi:hypothetical protein